ncbi:DNA glycosylase AlkZ-like family protein [Cellulomonas triticagri]|uniref:Winged helix-turn-helix domain-containing protein n=1 Tax=Cellulomonas triticagri TaxID=2483352 RepID=A0A3M2JFH6_9CELL|nr:crosslink repair DNA glycosylase YcaQ family protein [Cellulomonas triticagri]RMI12522.1 winged helix-turn-helix domain-containing protein [Cellulomonas triticagri]
MREHAADPLPIAQARRLAVAAQGLHDETESAVAVLRRAGLLQRDPLTRVARAHTLTCAARMPVAPVVGGVDRDLWPVDGRPATFETYTHAACVMPIGDWPLFEIHRARARERTDTPPAAVRERVRATIGDSEQGLTIRELQRGDRTGGGWGWSETKRAAEHMVWRGELAATRRRRRERVLDLAERAVPTEHLDRTLTPGECVAALVDHALRALGVATTEDLATYYRLPAGQVAAALHDRGHRPIAVEGWSEVAWVVEPEPSSVPGSRARLIGPFDNLIRDRARTRRLFGFDYVFEAYKPEARRTYGAYVLAVLVGDDLVARADVHRQGQALTLRRVFAETARDEDWCRARTVEAVEALATQLGLDCET